MTSYAIDTSSYVFAHGHSPRGNGLWAFFFNNNRTIEDAFWIHSSYADAKKAAIREAKARGAFKVEVGS